MAKKTVNKAKPVGSGKRKTAAKRPKLPVSAAFLKKANKSIRSQLRAATNVPSFLDTLAAGEKLTFDERNLLIDQALVLLEGAYSHLPLKKAMHAVDPIQRLRLLRQLQAQIAHDFEFHNEMTEIFTSVRDLHTNYLLPAPFKDSIAFLPFRVEACWENNDRKYLVSGVMEGFSDETADREPEDQFGRGVEILHWNGVPIERAVELNAARHAGSNIEAGHARGVAGMTIRPLVRSLPPDEERVIIRYRTETRKKLEFKQEWLIFQLEPEAGSVDADAEAGSLEATALGVDVEGDTIRYANKILFAPKVVKSETKISGARSDWPGLEFVSARGFPPRDFPDTDFPDTDFPDTDFPDTDFPDLDFADGKVPIPKGRSVRRGSVTKGAIKTIMPKVFAARPVPTSRGTYGYIRIFTFSVQDANLFVSEFVRLAAQLPQNGLILDVRDNGGGLIFAGERLLQVLTPRPIEPERVQFINTSLTSELCRLHSPSNHLSDFDLEPWKKSIEQAVRTGATYSRGFPITSAESCNAIGQKYHGPALLITNARCYSTTDIFAAGFQDHNIGPILGTDGNTGAGGANVWTHGLFRYLFSEADPPHDPLPSSPFKPLPNGTRMRIAVRRSLRVGEHAGTPIEDLGVQPNYRHDMTRKDLLERNVDLIERAGEILSKMPVYSLLVTIESLAEAKLIATATTENLTRLDVYVDGRPRQTLDIADGFSRINVNAPASPTVLDVKGFKNGVLVAAQRVRLQ